MVHAIEFRWVILAQVDRPEYSYQQQVVIKKGTQMDAHIKPYVVESPNGPVEVADLHLDDGGVARAVPFAAFWFLDSAKSRKA